MVSLQMRRSVRSVGVAFAFASAGAVLVCVWSAGCNVYDPDLLRPPAPPTDSGRPVVTTCKPKDDYAVCARPDADGICLDGACTIVRCHKGFFDCDDLADDGCEAKLDTPDSCGACGERCALPHVARHRCETSAEGALCAIDRDCNEGDSNCVADAFENGCNADFADCDGVAANGCETSLHTLTNCGACGKACALDVSEASCETGKCVFIGCASGFGDCDGRGCKSLADDVGNCGECDQACGSDVARCYGGRCTSLRCDSDKADCDGKVANDCEADLTSVETCGTCAVACGPYDHGSADCTEQQCVISRCDNGFIDCDDARDNGCETNATRSPNCGTCGRDCDRLPHVVSAECRGGECSALACEAGWGDCDGKSDNGCERLLNTNDDCDKCGQACDVEHGASSCETGQCVISACDDGFDDCNGDVADGCEAVLDSDTDCGKCENACPAEKSCKNGGCGCTDDSGCTDGAMCCDGACIDTVGVCYPWPCIPGTARAKNNCGACGEACPTWCCT